MALRLASPCSVAPILGVATSPFPKVSECWCVTSRPKTREGLRLTFMLGEITPPTMDRKPHPHCFGGVFLMHGKAQQPEKWDHFFKNACPDAPGSARVQWAGVCRHFCALVDGGMHQPSSARANKFPLSRSACYKRRGYFLQAARFLLSGCGPLRLRCCRFAVESSLLERVRTLGRLGYGGYVHGRRFGRGALHGGRKQEVRTGPRLAHYVRIGKSQNPSIRVRLILTACKANRTQIRYFRHFQKPRSLHCVWHFACFHQA